MDIYSLAAALVLTGKRAVKPSRVQSLDGTELVNSNVIEAVGAPEYVDESKLGQYVEYGITDTGWYVFARLNAPEKASVTDDFDITGAAGYKDPAVGDTFVDVAVKFTVAAESQKVTVNWGTVQDSFIFKATDLAVRNMDYRVTFYQYDLAPYCTWTWAAATGNFVANQSYYTKDGDVYTKAEVTVGAAIPANTYYIHTALTIEGFVRNISYMLEEIDCPVTINLPATDAGYGAWFEVQTYFPAAKSMAYFRAARMISSRPP